MIDAQQRSIRRAERVAMHFLLPWRFEMLALGALLAPQDPAALWIDGHREEAIAALTAAVDKAPADRELRGRLVTWELQVHRYRAALDHMQPMAGSARALRGEALYHLGEYARAVELLSDDDPAQVLMRIDAFEALERFAESDASLVRARATLGAQDPRVLSCEGRRLAREARFDEAAAAFRAALAQDPLDGEALFGLGRALVQGGKRDEGLAVLEKHRRLTPLLDQLDFAQRGLDLAPAHAPNHTALGDAERALGRLDRAEAAYRAAARFATPEELVPNTLRHARLLSDDRGNAQAAIDLLVKTAEHAPDARLFVRAGDLMRDAQRESEAIAMYAKALALRPKDSEVQKRIDDARATIAGKKKE